MILRMNSIERRTVRSVLAKGAMMLVIAVMLSGCDESEGPRPESFRFDFEADMQGWQPMFADYPARASADEQSAIDAFYELSATHARLPSPLNTVAGTRELSGSNHSDDLKMLVKKELQGLSANTNYEVDVVAIIASNAPQGCAGVGGAPGEGVWIRAGVLGREPSRVLSAIGNSSYWRLNVDIGDQASDGADGRVLGNFANSQTCESSTSAYELKTISTIGGAPLPARTDANGALWVVFGTDSGFEGVTRLFIESVEITAQPSS
jgi:hypothetical protein